MKDNNGIFTGRGYSLAHWESRDSFDWRPAKHVFVTTPQMVWTDGVKKKLNALERPQLIFDAHGVPVVLLCAGAYHADRERSFNVAIPLRRPASSVARRSAGFRPASTIFAFCGAGSCPAAAPA